MRCGLYGPAPRRGKPPVPLLAPDAGACARRLSRTSFSPKLHGRRFARRRSVMSLSQKRDGSARRQSPISTKTVKISCPKPSITPQSLQKRTSLSLRPPVFFPAQAKPNRRERVILTLQARPNRRERAILTFQAKTKRREALARSAQTQPNLREASARRAQRHPETREPLARR